MVSWSYYIHPTDVVNRLTSQTFPLPATAVQSKGAHLKFVNKPPYIDNKPTATPSGEVIEIDTQTEEVIKPTATPSGEVIKIDTQTAEGINIIYKNYT